MLRTVSTRMALQITLVIVLVVSVSGILGYVRVSGTVEHNTELRFSETVARGAALARSQVDDTSRLMLTGSSLLATGPAVVERFARNDIAGVVQLAAAQRAAVMRVVPQDTGIVLYDAAGKVLLRAHAPLAGVEPIPETVRGALAGTPTPGLRREVAFGLAFSGATPIRDLDGKVFGAVEVVSSAGEGFVKRLADLTGAEVSIVAADDSSASSEAGLKPTTAELTADAAAMDRPVSLTIDGRPYLSMVVPLTSASGARLALLYVGVERQQIVAEQRAAQRQVLGATAVAMAIGAGLAGGLGLLFTRPLTALVRSARRIQDNDLASPVPQGGARELRQLGAAMDEMRLAIREARENLVGANRQLAERAEASAAGLAEATQELAVLHGVTTGIAHSPADAPRVVSEQLVRLDWVDGACVLLQGSRGSLDVAAERGLRPGAAEVVLGLVRRQSSAAGGGAVYLAGNGARGPLEPLLAQGIRAVAALPLPDDAAPRGLLVVCAERPTEFTDARRSLLQAVCAEVTASLERYELARAVEASQRLAESVLREMRDGAIVLDSEGRCQICNEAAARMIGVDPTLAHGRPAEEWMPMPAATLDRLRRMAGPGEEAAPDILIEREGRLLAFTAGPLLEPEGGRRGTILLVRDVTETVATERLKQDFVSMVGHELRTPLTLIRTSIDLLTEQGAGQLTPTQRRITEVLHNNSDRLLRLINDLLDMSALDSGRLRVHMLPTSLSAVVDEVLPNYRQESEEREVAITLELPREDVIVSADRARIGQVLSNLMDNAMKYTPSGGHIVVRVIPGAPFVLVQIEDNGIGILPSEQASLFEKFQRTTAGERQSGGTGLGLAIARSIVELHGGKIWCESDGRSGSTFSFTLPCLDPDGATPGA